MDLPGGLPQLFEGEGGGLNCRFGGPKADNLTTKHILHTPADPYGVGGLKDLRRRLDLG